MAEVEVDEVLSFCSLVSQPSVTQQHISHHVSQNYQSFSRLCNAMSPLSSSRTKDRQVSMGPHRLVVLIHTSRLMCCAMSFSSISPGTQMKFHLSHLLDTEFLHCFLRCQSVSGRVHLRCPTSRALPTSMASCCMSSLFHIMLGSTQSLGDRAYVLTMSTDFIWAAQWLVNAEIGMRALTLQLDLLLRNILCRRHDAFVRAKDVGVT